MDYSEAIAQIRDVLSEVIPQHGSLGFSGGLDSTLIMHLSGYRLKGYTAGFNDSHDVRRSQQVSKALDFSIRIISLEKIDIESHLRLLKEIDETITRSEIGYELILSIIMSTVDDDTVITGQGADEFFYGYRKAIESRSNSEQVAKLLQRTLPREKKMAKYYRKDLITPYLDDRITSIARSFGPDQHIRDGTGKAMIRDVARISGLPDMIYGYGKKAAQYGSGIDRYLKRTKYFLIL
ncbi:asparagine synthase C-terminal domain-containing protein [Thermoplasma sp.]|uniref:asparagine synthase C-terminal domain-containing protein n=1 Tax=Thermoplasma sp. TaxID=1973142 RepID=UPI001278CCB1|nr:asparagine synthase-related protein [Thermoplasma sp.]KAA8922769.1 MAG: asparagine synthase [Thermoplasma sp.]